MHAILRAFLLSTLNFQLPTCTVAPPCAAVSTLPFPTGDRCRSGSRTLVMGIVNVTPDSFSDGGLLLDADRAVERACRWSRTARTCWTWAASRRGRVRSRLRVSEELARVLPVIERLAARVTRADFGRHLQGGSGRCGARGGASIVNDISGLRYEPALGGVVARRGAALILMHTRGRSSDMYRQADYHDVVDEVLDELRESIAFATGAGVPKERSAHRPGLGFAKEPPTATKCWRGSRSSATRTSAGRRRLPQGISDARRSDARCRRSNATGRRPRPSPPLCSRGAHIVRVHAVA